MKKLDLFILKSFFGPFLMTFLIVTFTLMMQFLWLYIDELVGKGLSLGIIFEFLAWGSATLIPLALPLSTLIASLMTMGNMGENNELLAMKAAGISLQRILKPLIYVSAIISVAAFFASNNLIPVAYNNIYTLREDIGRTKEEIKIPTGIFYNGIDGYTIRVTKNGENGAIYEVMVYDHSKNKGNVSITVADSGIIKLSPNKTSLVFTLFNGTNYEEDNQRNYGDTTLNLNRISFTEQKVIIPLQNYAFKKSDDSKYGSEVMSKNLNQLNKDKDSLDSTFSKLLDGQLRRAIYNSSLTSSYQLDTSERFAKMPLFPIDSLFKWDNPNQELNGVQNAISRIDEQIATADYYEREMYQTAYPLRRTIVERFRKFTLSFACIIFFFIGAPLGAIIRKGGLGTPVIVSAFFFVIYWVVDISGKKLANDGAILPFVGTFISTLVLLPMGIFLTWKSTRDSALFNADAYINFIKNIAKKDFIKSKIAKIKLLKKERQSI